MVQRLTYRRRHSYATKSNKQRVLRTPGEQHACSMAERAGGGVPAIMRACRLEGLPGVCSSHAGTCANPNG
jgi:large subunit ribosomal protein L34e